MLSVAVVSGVFFFFSSLMGKAIFRPTRGSDFYYPKSKEGSTLTIYRHASGVSDQRVCVVRLDGSLWSYHTDLILCKLIPEEQQI